MQNERLKRLNSMNIARFKRERKDKNRKGIYDQEEIKKNIEKLVSEKPGYSFSQISKKIGQSEIITRYVLDHWNKQDSTIIIVKGLFPENNFSYVFDKEFIKQNMDNKNPESIKKIMIAEVRKRRREEREELKRLEDQKTKKMI